MLKKYFQLSFAILALSASFATHAGFREALSALQHNNTELTLSEVESAVKIQNHDGLSLFLSTIESNFYVFDLDNHYEENRRVWAFLTPNQKTALLSSLKKIQGVEEEGLRDTLSNVIAILETNIVTKQVIKANPQVMGLFASAGEPYGYIKDVSNQADYDKKMDEWLSKTLVAGEFNEFIMLKYAKVLLGYPVVLSYPKDLDLKKLQMLESYKKHNLSKKRLLNKKLGYQKLEDLIINSESADANCLMGDLFKEGNYVLEDKTEAYKWYTRAYLLGEDANLYVNYPTKANCGFLKLTQFYESGDLRNIDRDFYNKVKSLGAVLPLPVQLNNTQRPNLLNKLQPISLIRPVIEVIEDKPNYHLQVFKDGLIRYKSSNFHKWRLLQGVKRADVSSFNALVGEDEWRIEPKVVDSLINELTEVGINEMPHQKTQGLLCDTGETAIHSVLKLRVNGYRKVVYFQGWLNLSSDKYPELSALLSAVEKHIPTQHLRCGEELLTKAYLDCEATDKKIVNVGNRWLANQNTKK